MARVPLLFRFARWHIWLGWLIAVPLLLWTASGLFMALRPIEEVRGEALRRPPPALAAAPLALPQLPAGQALASLQLVAQAGGPVWVAKDQVGAASRFAAGDGHALGPVGEAEARTIARSVFAGPAALVGMVQSPAAHPPLDLRMAKPAWQAAFADGTHLYIDVRTGEVLALRTRWWRAYDFMWGLHIMDLQTREETSHPVLILFAVLGLAGTILGTALLFRRRKARRR